MAIDDFDAPPRDEIQPTPEEVRRSPAARAPHPDEFDGPDDLTLDDELITRSRMPSVSWAKADIEQPDYAHLEPAGREPVVGDKKFKITAAEIELLIKANAFDPKGPDSRIVFAFRGASLIDSDDRNNDGVVAGVNSIQLEETRPDHRNFRCTIGYLNRQTRKISAFRASTVPNVKFMTNYYMWNNGLGGNSNTGANMMPTGCYVYRMGAHGGGRIYPALRLTNPDNLADDGSACVLRSKNDLTFKTDDFFDACTPYDNIHCAYAYDSFSSAGCQTIQGPNGEGPWGHFQAVLKTMKVNTRIDYMLLTGREASIAAWLRDSGRAGDDELVARLLGRLRPGSRSAAVGRLQEKLGMAASGYFGPATKKKLAELQRSKGALVDGIWSPKAEDKLEWSLFKAPEPLVVPAATPAVVAPPAVTTPVAVQPVAVPPPVAPTPPAPATPSSASSAPIEPRPVAPAPSPVAAVIAATTAAATAAAAAPAAVAAAVAGATSVIAAPVGIPPQPAAPVAPPAAAPVIATPVAPASAPAVSIPAPASPVAATPPPASPIAAPVGQVPAVAAPAPVQPAAPLPRPSGVSAAVAAELEKLARPDASPEAPGIVDIAGARIRFPQVPAPATADPPPSITAGVLTPPLTTAMTAAAASAAAATIAGGGGSEIVAKPATPTHAPPPPPAQPVVTSTPPAGGAALGIVTSVRKLVLDGDKISEFARNALPQYRDALLGGNEMLTRYGVNQTPMRLCHFLGQIGNECGRLTILEENMTYRSAARLRAVWPTRFPTLASAEPYVNNPQKLAEKVYGGRFDNRPGDGWRYRGRGLVQITGRSSYREMGRKLGIPLEDQPDLAVDPKHALAIACETWAGKTLGAERDMNRLADANKLEAMTYRINGGFTNIDDRRDAFEEAWDIWGTGKPPRRTLEPDTLDRGDRAGRVEELNARLDELKLFEGITTTRPTQVFNLSTYKAVCALQEDAGVAQSGVVSADTWAALEKALDQGGTTRAVTRGSHGTRAPAGRDSGSLQQRDAVVGRLKEIRAWSVALALLALAFVAGYIFALTSPTGNTPLWMPLVFAGMVFVTGLAMWLAARVQPSWSLPDPATSRTRSAPQRTERGPSAFVPDEEEPVRQGTNIV